MQIVTYFSDFIFFAFIFIQLQGVYFLCSETNSAILKTLMRLETEDNVLNLFKKLQEEVKVHQNIHVLTIRQFLITTAHILFRNIMRRASPASRCREKWLPSARSSHVSSKSNFCKKATTLNVRQDIF